MRVLVTGASGFIGSHVCRALLSAGHTVVGIDSLITGKREWMPGGAALVEADLCKIPRPVTETDEIDAVVHLAAYADLRSNWKDHSERSRLLGANVVATMGLLEAVRPGIPFVFASSASVYGSQCSRALDFVEEVGGLPEEAADPESIESPYAATKLAGEALVAAYAHARKFPWYALRFVNVIGARNEHGVIGDFAKMALRDGAIHAKDNGRQRKSWVHVDDVAGAICRLIDPSAVRVPSGVYNVTSRERWSWRNVVEVMGLGPEKVTCEDSAGGAVGDPLDLHVSGAKLDPWYECKRPVIDGVRDALASMGWK